jgi:hypothetical protein
MAQDSPALDRHKDLLSGDARVWVGGLNAILESMRDASRGGQAALTQDLRDLAAAIEAAQADLPADHEAEEQDEGGVLGRQRAPGLHAPAEFLVQSLNDIRGAQRLPLPLRELEEREQLLATLLQAADDSGTARRPLPLEGSIGDARDRRALGVDDAVDDDLVARGLAAPVWAVIEGHPGLRKAVGLVSPPPISEWQPRNQTSSMSCLSI